jgi:hypothetical protein
MSDVAQDLLVIPVAVAGAVSVANGALLYPLPYAADLVRVDLKAATGPVGAAMIANVAKNGAKVFAGAARPTIADGATAGTLVPPAPVAQDGQSIPFRTPDNWVAGTTGGEAAVNAYHNVILPLGANAAPLASFAAGDTVRVDVDQVGSGTAGSNLAVVLTFARR